MRAKSGREGTYPSSGGTVLRTAKQDASTELVSQSEKGPSRVAEEKLINRLGSWQGSDLQSLFAPSHLPAVGYYSKQGDKLVPGELLIDAL